MARTRGKKEMKEGRKERCTARRDDLIALVPLVPLGPLGPLVPLVPLMGREPWPGLSGGSKRPCEPKI